MIRSIQSKEPAMSEPERVEAERLAAFAADAYRAVGVPAEDAAAAAELMLRSDLAGADGHGVFRLPQYIRRIRAGGLNVTPQITVRRTGAATALVDGDNGLGHLVMRRAAETAIAIARESGAGWVGVRRGNHAGAASVYASMPPAHDMIGLYLAVGNANHLPPWGGIDLLLSTNPIAIAVPAMEQPPLVLDMATTVAAYGKVKVAAQRGEQMPQGWMIDRQGHPLLDPARADDGFLLPIGGYKGAGLALMFGLLAGTLNGAAMGRDVVDFNKDDVTPTNTGQAILALDIARFGDPVQFKRQVDDLIRQLKSSAVLPGFSEIRLPGEQMHARRAERAVRGIPLPPPLRAALDRLADDLAIDRLLRR
jgi:L-2-hydroxycarboxylate dehydrogenase (NAD+)